MDVHYEPKENEAIGHQDWKTELVRCRKLFSLNKKRETSTKSTDPASTVIHSF